VSRSAEIFLGLIALATLAMAIVQVGVIVIAGLLARRMIRLVDHVERDLQPLLANVNAIGRDAARTVAVAAAQVDRVDKMINDLVARVEETVSSLTGPGGPAGKGRAMVAAFRAAFGSLRDARRARQRRSDDEDALFI
jgi:hypothetical protein